MEKKKVFLFITLLMALSLILISCKSGEEGEDDTLLDESIGNESKVDSSDKKEVGTSYEELISMEEAYNIFTSRYPDVRLVKLELDKNKGNRYFYKLEGYDDRNEIELKLDASTSGIVKEELDDLDDNYGELSLEDISKAEEFLSKSLEDLGQDSSLDEFTLEIDDGLKKIEVELIDRDAKKVEYKKIIN